MRIGNGEGPFGHREPTIFMHRNRADGKNALFRNGRKRLFLRIRGNGRHQANFLGPLLDDGTERDFAERHGAQFQLRIADLLA